MAMLCICGICIPYTVLWPIVLIFLKQVWSFIFPSTKAKTVEDKKAAQQNDEPVPKEDFQRPLDYKSQFVWEDVVGRQTTTVLRFTAKWCKPCKTLDPLFEELCKETNEKAVFYNVDVDECDEVAAQNGAITIPLFVSYRGGKLVGKLSGSDHDKIREFVWSSVNGKQD